MPLAEVQILHRRLKETRIKTRLIDVLLQDENIILNEDTLDEWICLYD